MKKISAVKRRVPKNTQTLHKTINPHPNIFPQTPFELLPDPNKTSTIKTDPKNPAKAVIWTACFRVDWTGLNCTIHLFTLFKFF